MKKIILTIVCCLCVPSTFAAEGESTLSAGWAHSLSKAKGAYVGRDTIRQNGINIKYSYEITNTFGIIGSFTYTKGNKNYQVHGYSGNINSKYFSYMVGPTWRAHDNVVLYGMAGIAKFKSKNTLFPASSNASEYAPAYTLGVQLFPVKDIVLDFHFEHSRIGDMGPTISDSKVDTFGIGIGYHF